MGSISYQSLHVAGKATFSSLYCRPAQSVHLYEIVSHKLVDTVRYGSRYR